MTYLTPIADLPGKLRAVQTRPTVGFVTQVKGQSIRGQMIGASMGMVCRISNPDGSTIHAEIVGIAGDDIILSPFGGTEGCATYSKITLTSDEIKIEVSDSYLGRVVDAFGKPIDGPTPIDGPFKKSPLRQETPDPMHRPIISDQFGTGIRSLDSMITFGVGQRIGIFGPPGTGKTSLLSMLASRCDAEIIVVGLVGERGREVREFVDEVLPPDMRARSVVVAATSDRPAFERSICALTATTVAEHFRDQGKKVLLLIDSLTRTARALRELGLAAGEAPTRRGYPSSVYPALPAIIERAGRTAKGDITAVYTVLTEGNIDSDPIAEEVRSLTDGHIVLSRKLAEAGHFPAIDVASSLSRTMSRIIDQRHAAAAFTVRQSMAKYQEIEMLLQVGEYSSGHDAQADRAIAMHKPIKRFLRQRMQDTSPFKKTIAQLIDLCR